VKKEKDGSIPKTFIEMVKNGKVSEYVAKKIVVKTPEEEKAGAGAQP
jgi:hypothetical protein